MCGHMCVFESTYMCSLCVQVCVCGVSHTIKSQMLITQVQGEELMYLPCSGQRFLNTKYATAAKSPAS